MHELRNRTIKKSLMKVKIENERETEKFNAVVRRIRIIYEWMLIDAIYE